MLEESGGYRIWKDGGGEWTFAPSFGRLASLGNPIEIVKLYADLHGAEAPETARYVLAGLCEQDDALPLIGWRDDEGLHDGLMPAAYQVLLARRLMQHGIIGKTRPGKGDGKFSDRFDAAEYVAAAMVLFGLAREDAEALSMTEFQTMREMKFPDANKGRDVPTREEYAAAMKAHKERQRG